jgi:hypothetical protein
VSTAAEKRYMAKVAALGCVACRNMGIMDCPACIHHVRTGQGAGQRAPDGLVIPLCNQHHQTGGHGVAIHEGKEAFERIHGSELALLAQTIIEVSES